MSDRTGNPDVDDLPDYARAVAWECVSEAWTNVEAGDVHTPADVAADIAERLYRSYGVRATA